MTVFSLPANQPETFYRGAGRIAAFRSGPALADRPEDWVASTTTRFGLAPSGLSALPDGRLLADAIVGRPGRWWLGPGRHRHRDPGQAARRRAAAAAARAPGPPVRARAPGLAVRQDRGLGDRLGRAGRGRCTSASPATSRRRSSPAGWPVSGRRDAGRHQPDPDPGRRRGALPGRAAARHRRRGLPGRDPGADRLLGAARVRRLRPGRRRSVTWGWAATWRCNAWTAARGARSGWRRCAATTPGCCPPRPIRSSPRSGCAVRRRRWRRRSPSWSWCPAPAR